jgi:hypothetical protein
MCAFSLLGLEGQTKVDTVHVTNDQLVIVVNGDDGKKSKTADSNEEKKKSGIGGLQIVDWEDLGELVIRFVINIFFVLLLVRAIYYPIAKRKDFLFTFVLISVTVFLLCFMLENVKLELGFALGLFAIFGIIRYRTDPIPIKEMTYLFIVIGLSVMNALINKKISLAEMVFANTVILAATYGLEKVWLLRHESQKIVLYENIELIHYSRREELMNDLQTRTGLNINRIDIGKIDYLRDTAQIRLYFYADEQPDQRDERSTESGFST